MKIKRAIPTVEEQAAGLTETVRWTRSILAEFNRATKMTADVNADLFRYIVCEKNAPFD